MFSEKSSPSYDLMCGNYVHKRYFCVDCRPPLMVVGAEPPLVTETEIKVNIQSSSRGKVNILGGDSIGHYEREKKKFIRTRV